MFGNIENGQMVLNEFGKEAKKSWEQIPKYFSYVHMDEYVFMPNHMHGIIMIEPVRRDAIYGVSRHLWRLNTRIQTQEWRHCFNG